MSNYSRWRDEFIVEMRAEGLTLDAIRTILRYSNTLDRLAVAQCNGDFPADHGDAWPTEPCPNCGSCWHPSAITRVPASLVRHLGPADPAVTKEPTRACIDCRTAARVRALLPPGFTAHFGGDPRGCVLSISVPSGRTSYNGAEGISVPARAH